jgi:ADP-ribose pyrophosphatase
MPIVFTSRVFSVEVDTIRYPDGRQHEVAIVRHPSSVVLIPVQDDGRVVLIRQFRPSINRELWELPAGKVEPGETAEGAAARECEEETGLVPGRVDALATLFPTPGFCDEKMLFFRLSRLAPPAAGSTAHADDDEDIEVRAVAVNEARAMVARGEIVDLKTAYGLTLIQA